MSHPSKPSSKPAPSLDPETITASSKSNLAFAFFTLPADRRRDMAIFYAFCRLADDLADSPELGMDQRLAGLDELRRWISEESPSHPFASQLREVMKRRGIDPAHLCAILDGVQQDLDPKPFATFGDLQAYCHLVAGEVGLVSLRIFGCEHPDSETYAIQLGHALQLTNILRDVGEDLANGNRIYLPLEDLDRFGIRPEELAHAEGSPAFLEMMEFQYRRARQFFADAERARPASERRRLLAAEIMRHIYSKLLEEMRRRRYPVLSTRLSLGYAGKILCVGRALASCL